MSGFKDKFHVLHHVLVRRYQLEVEAGRGDRRQHEQV